MYGFGVFEIEPPPLLPPFSRGFLCAIFFLFLGDLGSPRRGEDDLAYGRLLASRVTPPDGKERKKKTGGWDAPFSSH